ncbi:MAG: hypothetical protein KAW52_04340 [candidate division Zixibacteria bacterium]|nr:hypothetical protein [candidate division Zixibacteria bacterium]
MLGITKLLINLQEKNLWLVIGLFILAIFLAFLTYKRTYPPISKRKKALLLSLRIVALFCLFLILSEPILTIARRFVQKPVVAILVDTSKSMNLKGTQISRKEELQNLLEDRTFEKLSSKATLETYGFADTLFPFDSSQDFPESLGKATSIGEATKYVEEKLKDKNLRGILILSDGANNLGEDPVFVAKSKDIPIYTCGIGEYTPPKDIAIERIVHHDIGYVDNKIPIQVDISQVGFDKLKIPISIKKISGSGGKETQAQKNLTLSTSGGTQALEFAITPKEEGLHQYELTVPQQKEELVKENNRRIFSIKVLKSKIKVLLVTGSLNWEYTFLKRALEKDKNIELKSLVYGKNKKVILGRFPQGEKELSQSDILIFVDPPNFIFAQYKKEINDFVFRNGGSALFLLGKDFIASKAFMEATSILPFDLGGAKIRYFPANLSLELTSEGSLHPITRLVENSEENLKVWSEFPPFLGVASLGSPSKDAVILATFKNPSNPEIILPGIVVKNYGKGKMMAATVNPFWRWDFLLWGIGKDNRSYQKLWNNSVRWLITREDMDIINIFTDKKIYKSGERINFCAKIFDQNYQKIKDASVLLKIKGEAEADSEMLSLSLDQMGDYRGILRSLSPGKYLFEGEVFRDETKVGSKKGEFTVEEYSLEDADLSTDFDLLKKMAEVSGGKFYEKDQIGNLVTDLELAEKQEERTKEIQLWNHPILLILFIGCLSAEWAIRKRAQLL